MKFRYHNPTVLYFGDGQLEESLLKEASRTGDSLLLVFGQGSVMKTGLYERVQNIFKKGELTVYELGGIKPNASLHEIRMGIEICRSNKVDLVLAIGGGSVIDSAKAIAAGALYEGDVWDFFSERASIQNAIPIGTILTTAGTGSEMNPFAVVTNEASHEKRIIASVHLYPRFSFCEPKTTVSLSSSQTAYGIIDMFTHVVENYFTRSTNLIVQKRFAEALMKTIVECGKEAIRNPSSVSLRETLMLGSTMALNGMVNMGAVGDWSTHTIVDEIGGCYDVPHGALLSVVLPAWMDYIQQDAVDLLCSLGEQVFDLVRNGKEDECIAKECILHVKDLFKELGAPQSLSELRIDRNQIEAIAESVVKSGPVGTIRSLYLQDIINILNKCV